MLDVPLVPKPLAELIEWDVVGGALHLAGVVRRRFEEVPALRAHQAPQQLNVPFPVRGLDSPKAPPVPDGVKSPTDPGVKTKQVAAVDLDSAIVAGKDFGVVPKLGTRCHGVGY
eukprot:EG_transcript_21453